jgi:hypothetical protein
MAEARGLDLTPAELERILPILENIESVFGPLSASVSHEMEPAIVLSDAAVAGE